MCEAPKSGYRAKIGDAEETPEQKAGDAEREVDRELGELEREGDRMEERLDANDDQADDGGAAKAAEGSGPVVDETDVPEDEGESAEESGQ